MMYKFGETFCTVLEYTHSNYCVEVSQLYMILYTILLCVVYVRYFRKWNTKIPENYGKTS